MQCILNVYSKASIGNTLNTDCALEKHTAVNYMTITHFLYSIQHEYELSKYID